MFTSAHRITFVGCVVLLCCSITIIEWSSVQRTKIRIREAIEEVDREYEEMTSREVIKNLKNLMSQLSVESDVIETDPVIDCDEPSVLENEITEAISNIKTIDLFLSDVVQSVKKTREDLEPFIDKISSRWDRMLYNYI